MISHQLREWDQIPLGFSMGDEIAPEITNTVLPLAEKLGLKGGKLLDAGCLDGRNTIPLATGGYFSEVIAVDLEWSRAHLERLTRLQIPNLTIFEVKRREPYPFPIHSFEVVLSWRVIHCVTDFEERMEFLGRLFDMIAPGGILALSARKFNSSENYHCSRNSDRVLVCERFEKDVPRIYYSNFGLLRREIYLALPANLFQIIAQFDFEEYEIRNDEKEVIPCLGMVIKRM